MIEFSDAVATATGYVADATKASQSIAAFVTSVTATKGAIDIFRETFLKTRRKNNTHMGVCELIEYSSTNRKTEDIRSLTGILTPIIGFKGEEEESYKNVSTIIRDDIANLSIRTAENEFLISNSKEWLTYGCSLQSTTSERIQIMSMVETEEAHSIPIIVSNRFFRRKLNDSDFKFGVNATVSGLKIPLENENIQRILGREKTEKLALNGNNSVVIPDESIINDLNIDFSFSPDIYFNGEKCFYLGYLWVIYINVRSGEIIPIYEYGNIGEKNSFTLLSEKLIHQIEFFKKRLWNEYNLPPERRQYKLLVSLNDGLTDRIKSVFQEDNFFEDREELLYGCREEIIENLF